MPTLSKLIAAVIFAAIGFFAADAVMQAMPEGTKFGPFQPLCTVIGLVSGWWVMGGLVGRGYNAALGYGLRTSVTLAAWGLFSSSILVMVRKAFRKLYDTPLEAVVDIFQIMLKNAPFLADPSALSILAIGGAFGGLTAEWIKRRWD